MADRSLRLFDIIKARAFGPITIGMSATDLSHQIDPPDFWGVSSTEPRLPSMIFGCVYVSTNETDDDIRIVNVEMKLPEGERAPFYKDLDGNQIFILVPVGEEREIQNISRRLEILNAPHTLKPGSANSNPKIFIDNTFTLEFNSNNILELVRLN
jgi:hypothetical protein